MKKFRLLTADEIECRIGTVNEKGFSLLLYKTARTDANLLDETVGAENWANDFKVVDGVLYGGIGIYFENVDHWVWKWDAGTESNTEAEKGRASDAFKRAGFKHGIGRELYTSPFIWISDSDKKDRFSVKDIGYDESGKINRLTIYNETTEKTVFQFPKGNNTTKSEKAEKPKEQPKKGEFKPTCTDCNKEISISVHDWSVKEFKTPLCIDCQDKRRKAQKK